MQILFHERDPARPCARKWPKSMKSCGSITQAGG
jgi:hypothetical protein